MHTHAQAYTYTKYVQINYIYIYMNVLKGINSINLIVYIIY